MSIWARLVILVAAFALGGAAGIKWQIGVQAERDLQATKETLRKAERQTTADNKLTHERVRRATEYQVVVNPIVERTRDESYVLAPSGCRVSADGMRDIADLIRAANAAGGSDAAVPASAPASQ